MRTPFLLALLTMLIARDADAGTSQSQVPRIVVLTAVDFEYEAVLPLIGQAASDSAAGRQVTHGYVGSSKVTLVRTGWGKTNAAASSSLAFERFQPDLLIMAGVSGGLSASTLDSGDVVVTGEVFQHDLGKRLATNCEPATQGVAPCPFEIWSPQTPTETEYAKDAFSTPAWLSDVAVRAALQASYLPWHLPAKCECDKDGTRKPAACNGEELALGHEPPRVCVGTIATGDEFLADPETAKRLMIDRKAVSVDMETAAVAQEAATRGIPFLAVRLISDVVDANGEGLYYCLKPMAKVRLRDVMGKVLPAVAEAMRSGEQQTKAKIPVNLRDSLCQLARPQGAYRSPSNPAHSIRLR